MNMEKHKEKTQETKLSQKTEKTKENNTMLKDNCNACGKEGHKDVYCWKKEENTSKRPTKRKNKIKGEGVRVEVLLMNTDLLNYFQECIENTKGLNGPS